MNDQVSPKRLEQRREQRKARALCLFWKLCLFNYYCFLCGKITQCYCTWSQLITRLSNCIILNFYIYNKDWKPHMIENFNKWFVFFPCILILWQSDNTMIVISLPQQTYLLALMTSGIFYGRILHLWEVIQYQVSLLPSVFS